MANEAENQTGAAALKAYIDQMLESNGVAWEEAFIPDSVYSDGANDAIEAADAAEDQSPAGRSLAAAAAIRAAIDSTGQGGQISDRNCQEAANAILTAVAKVRAQENPPVKPQPAPVVDQPIKDEPPVDQPTDDWSNTPPENQPQSVDA